MGLLRMFKHRRDAKGDRKRLTKQYESTTSSHYHYNHNHSNDGNFEKDENDHSSSRHESNAYSFRTLGDTDDVNYYSDPEQQHYFSNGNSHNHNNNSKSHKNKKRSTPKKQSTSNQGSNFNHSNHNNSSEFNDAWDTDFPYLSHASSSPHHNDNNSSNNINNNSNASWSDQFHVMEASTMQQQQQYRPSYQGGGYGGHRPMYNDNFNSKNPRMRSQKDVMYPDSTDSELSDYEKAGKPHMIASAFDDDDDNGNEEREDDHIFMFGDFGKKSTSHATKAAVGRVGGGNRSSNNRNGFFGSISLPDHTAMIRSQYASQFKQRPVRIFVCFLYTRLPRPLTKTFISSSL